MPPWASRGRDGGVEIVGEERRRPRPIIRHDEDLEYVLGRLRRGELSSVAEPMARSALEEYLRSNPVPEVWVPADRRRRS